MLAEHAKLGIASVQYDWQNAVWSLPYAANIGGQKIPSFAAAIANARGSSDEQFRLDYSVKFSSIPTYSAGDVLNGRVGARELAGKDVLIGIASDVLGDTYFIPGYGRSYGVYIHAIGAETLKQGRPVDLGWFLPFLFGMAAAAAGATRKRWLHRYGILGASGAALLALPIFLEARLVFMDVTSALFVLLTVGTALGWSTFRVRGFVNTVSDLPNLNALRRNRDGRNQALIAARILNYEEITATLPPSSERQLVEQIVSRLKVGSPNRVLYQGDGGIFAWFEAAWSPFGNHLDALHSLFRNAARVGGVAFDLTIAFGVEIGSNRSLANRLASALVAAEEAAHDGLKWK